MKIYVGNLSSRTTAEAVQKMFGIHGQVQDVAIAMDTETKKSRGFCFVFMPDPEEGARAIKALNGKLLDGRTLNVLEAQKKKKKKSLTERPARRGATRSPLPSHRPPRRGFGGRR